MTSRQPESSGTPPCPLTGFLDVCDRTRIAGWAVDLSAPDLPVRLRILCDGCPVDETDADLPRTDLEGLPREGHCAFEWTWPEAPPHEGCLIEIVDVLLDRPLSGSPFRLAPLPATLRGSLDIADRRHVAGWVQDAANPDRTVWLTLWLDGKPVSRFPANQFRRDLREAGFGTGRHGFDHIFPAPLDPLQGHDIYLTHGDTPFGNPVTLARAGTLDTAMRNYLSTLLQGIDTLPEREKALSFLMHEAKSLKDRTGALLTDCDARARKAQARRQQIPTAPIPPTILFVDDQAPDTTRDAGSVAIVSHMSAIQALGYRVFFVASRRPSSEDDRRKLATLEIECLTEPFCSGPEDALRHLGDGLEAIYLHRLNNAECYSALARAFAPTATLIWSIADLASMRLHRQATIEHRPELDRMATNLEVRESMCAWLADVTITHSSVEAEWISRTIPTARAAIIPWAVPVLSRRKTTIDRPTITFVGHFAHAPNLDAAKWLVLDILPRLRKLCPDIRCRLIGSAMPHAIHQLAADDVEILGFVPDLHPALAQTTLCIAPLRYGAGLKGKVLESWSVGIPIVMTPIAAEGLVDSEDPLWEMAIASTAEDFARKTALFLEKPSLGRKQITEARKILRERFSAALMQETFRTLLPPVEISLPSPETFTDPAEPSLN